MEVKDLSASQAIKMVVLRQIRVKSAGISLAFHHPDDSDLGKGEKGSIHRVQGDVGKGPL